MMQGPDTELGLPAPTEQGILTEQGGFLRGLMGLLGFESCAIGVKRLNAVFLMF